MELKSLVSEVAVLLTLAVGSAYGATITIDFSGVSAPPFPARVAFSRYSQSDFTVAATSDNWFASALQPDIARPSFPFIYILEPQLVGLNPTTGTIVISNEDTLPFTFQSVTLNAS